MKHPEREAELPAPHTPRRERWMHVCAGVRVYACWGGREGTQDGTHPVGRRCGLLPLPSLLCNSTAPIPSMAPRGPDLRAGCLVSHQGAASVRPPSLSRLSPWHRPCAPAKLNYSSFPQQMLHFACFPGRAVLRSRPGSARAARTCSVPRFSRL